MIGRGTRSHQACKYFDWLPDGKKTEFLIFDFWNNFEFFDMNPAGKIADPAEALPTKIFLVRLQQYQYFKRNGDKENAEVVLSKLIKSVDDLPRYSTSIRERMREIEIVTKGKLFDTIGIRDEVAFLKEKIAPLMKYSKDINIKKETFRLKTEQLGLAFLYNVKKYNNEQDFVADKNKHFSINFWEPKYGFLLEGAKKLNKPITIPGQLWFFEVNQVIMKKQTTI